MGRPTKQGIDFPEWNPQRSTWTRINSLDFKTRIKALRSSSVSFTRRKDVKDIISKKCYYECVECETVINLEIDHIVSVYLAAKHEFLVKILNTEDNLQLLCEGCNASKAPERINDKAIHRHSKME